MENSRENLIYGRHPATEALRAGTPIDRIYLKKGMKPGFFNIVKKLAAQAKIPVTEVDEATLIRISGGANHQGVIAQASAREYDSVDDILQVAKDRGERPFIVILNEVQDPHNLGSIIRTASGAGVHGIIIPKRRAARLSPVVSKVSAGADSHMKVAIVTNISDTILDLKKIGIFVAGSDSDGSKEYFDFKYTGPIALVLGGEDRGLGERVKNSCDLILRIPLKGPVPSLNVGVAGAVLIFKTLENRETDNIN